jgi:Ca2+-binding EF-hand superfamily protein
MQAMASHRGFISVATLVIAMVLTTSSLARAENCNEDAKPFASYDEIPAVLKSRGTDYGTRFEEMYVARLVGVLRNTASEISLTDADIAKRTSSGIRGVRSQTLALFFRFDENGDAIVTEKEIQDSFESNRSSLKLAKEQAVEHIQRFDANKNGTIEKEEMTLSDEAALASLGEGVTYIKVLNETMSLDPNNDGVLTIPELTNVALRSFRTIDLDKNGVISDEERKSFEAAVRK